MRIYLAGPMRGYPDFNFPAFFEAADILRTGGHEVLNPAETDHNNGFNPAGTRGTDEDLANQGFDLRSALAFDLTWICQNADAVVLLDGWENSKGATAERAAAEALASVGVKVYSIHDFVEELLNA